MAKISAEERETATLVPLNDVLSAIDDTETAFNEFRESFHTGDEPGVVRAWELSIDERGNIGTTKAQTRLGSWPIDAYSLDELCQLLVEQYMQPDQVKMAVRLVGTDPKKSGYAFNRIMLLKRGIKKESSSPPGDSTGSLLKMLQEMNERNMAMFARLQAPKEEKTDTMAELQKMMVFAQAMNAPMQQMLTTLLPALAGRPVAPAAENPFGNLGAMIDVVERLNDLRGDSGGGGGDEGIAGILKAITPLAKPALEALPALAAMQAAARPRLPPARPSVAAPPPAAAPVAAARPAPAPTPPAAPNSLQPTDIPSGDQAMLAQLKPQIDALVQMAEQGADANAAADLIFDQIFMDQRLPEDMFEKLADFVDSPQFVSYVTLLTPAAKPHAAWFETFKSQIVKRLTEEDAAAGQTPSNGVGTGPVATG